MSPLVSWVDGFNSGPTTPPHLPNPFPPQPPVDLISSLRLILVCTSRIADMAVGGRRYSHAFDNAGPEFAVDDDIFKDDGIDGEDSEDEFLTGRPEYGGDIADGGEELSDVSACSF